MVKYVPRGVRRVSEILQKSKWFLLYYDPDIDGAISGELVLRFLTAYNQPFQYYINENRSHGLKMSDDLLQKLVGGTIILVDAAMTKQEVEKVTSMGINIINIDHHHIPEVDFVDIRDEVTGCEGVIINNQYPFEPEDQKYLSGAGVVYWVLKAVSPDLFGKDEEALVGLSLLSDIRPIENDHARSFLHTTYTHKSPYMEYLVNVTKNDADFGFGVQTFDRNFIDFTFSPKVNALFRLNKGDDAIDLFKGDYDFSNGLDVYRRIQNAITETITQNLHGEELSNLVYKYCYSDLATAYQYDITNFIGLACSRVKNSGKTTMLFVVEGGKVKRGSVRGNCDDVDYLQIFRRHGFKCDGHKNAFGVLSVDLANVDLQSLNNEIAIAEHGYNERKYLGRVLEVNNLEFFLKSKNAQVAEHNNYVRDPYRIFLQYTGNNIERNQRGKAIEFMVDGLRVLSFDQDLDPHNGLILPVVERGNYVQFYLKRR